MGGRHRHIHSAERGRTNSSRGLSARGMRHYLHFLTRLAFHSSIAYQLRACLRARATGRHWVQLRLRQFGFGVLHTTRDESQIERSLVWLHRLPPSHPVPSRLCLFLRAHPRRSRAANADAACTNSRSRASTTISRNVPFAVRGFARLLAFSRTPLLRLASFESQLGSLREHQRSSRH